MTENDQVRAAEMRINEEDRAAIKQARNRCFDQATPMGLVARLACLEMVKNRETASNVKL
jgi:hypothetical protein